MAEVEAVLPRDEPLKSELSLRLQGTGGERPAEVDDKARSPNTPQGFVSESSASPPAPRTAPLTLPLSQGQSCSPISGERTCATPSSMAANPGDRTTHPSQLPEDVMEILDEAEELRLTGYHFAAEKLHLDLINRLTDEGDSDLLAKVQRTKQHRDLIACLEEANSLLLKLLDDENWTLQKEADRCLVWTKPEPGSDLMTVRIAGIVEGAFDVFCSIGKEVAMIKNWMPGVKTSHLIKQLNTFDHIGYYVWKFPLVSAREFLVEETNLINDAEGYCIAKRQPPIPRADVELPGVGKGAIRAEICNWASFSLPLGQGSTFLVSVMNVDLKIPLPTRLVNYLSVSMGFKSFQELRQNVQNGQKAKSEFNKCILENVPFYERMRLLEKTRETKEPSCKQEILKTGWIKDPAERKALFNRSSGVLVPMA